MLKRLLIVFLAAAALCLPAACGTPTAASEAPAAPETDEIRIRVTGEGTPAVGLGVTYFLGAEPFGSATVQNASPGEPLEGAVEFSLQKGEVPEGGGLRDFSLQFSVMEKSGTEISCARFAFPAEYGQTYAFRLRGEDDCYTFLPEFPLADESPAPAPDAAALAQLGVWRLDPARTDEADYAERFPGYAEWGAALEFSEDGTMYWYIGAEGWHGDYSCEGETISAVMESELEPESRPFTFAAGMDGDTPALTMAFGERTVTWVPGEETLTEETQAILNGPYTNCWVPAGTADADDAER